MKLLAIIGLTIVLAILGLVVGYFSRDLWLRYSVSPVVWTARCALIFVIVGLAVAGFWARGVP
jgi:hypothetical protein